jgi:hypothetical protein
VGDAVEPTGQRGVSPNGAKPLRQDEKRRLEGVLGILLLL